jgi:hypothetical protein
VNREMVMAWAPVDLAGPTDPASESVEYSTELSLFVSSVFLAACG